VRFDYGPGQSPGSNSDVISLRQQRQAFFDLLDGHRVIRIHEQDLFAPGAQHTVTDRVAFAAVGAVSQDPQINMTGALKSVNNRLGVVGAAIAYHQDLRGVGLLAKIGQCLAEGMDNAVGFIIRWYDNGNFHGRFFSFKSPKRLRAVAIRGATVAGLTPRPLPYHC